MKVHGILVCEDNRFGQKDHLSVTKTRCSRMPIWSMGAYMLCYCWLYSNVVLDKVSWPVEWGTFQLAAKSSSFPSAIFARVNKRELIANDCDWNKRHMVWRRPWINATDGKRPWLAKVGYINTPTGERLEFTPKMDSKNILMRTQKQSQFWFVYKYWQNWPASHMTAGPSSTDCSSLNFRARQSCSYLRGDLSIKLNT